MGKNDNLIPLNKRSEAEKRAIQSKGGIASGKTRNTVKTFVKIASSMVGSKVANGEILKMLADYGISDKDVSIKALMVFGLIQKIIKTGDVNAFNKLEELLGENKPPEHEGKEVEGLLGAIEKAVKNKK